MYDLLREFWLVLMAVVFVAIVAWAFRPSRKREMEEHGEIPFKDDEPKGPGS